MIKICSKCKESKPLSLFHKCTTNKDGYTYKCAVCSLNDMLAWRQQNKDSRKQEYLNRKIRSIYPKTLKEHKEEKQANAKGRKATIFEYDSKRRSQKKRIELSELDLFVQKEATNLCKLRELSTGIKWHVDHIVPLNYKEACGLHNAFNLQVVPALWNIRKKNRNMDTYFNNWSV